MSTTYKGTDLVLVSTREDFDPQQGFVVVETWRGTSAAIAAKQQEANIAGKITSLVKRDGVPELEISAPDPSRNPDGSPDELITDDWQISSTFREEDVWVDPQLRNYLYANSIPQGAPVTLAIVDDAISVYRSTVEDHIKRFRKPDKTWDAERPGPTPLANFKPQYHDGSDITEAAELGFLNTIYDQIVKGGDKTRLVQVSVIRRRSIAAESASRFTALVGNLAWDRANFITKFQIPANVQRLLPAVPGVEFTPPGSQWAWALMAQEEETSGTAARVQETLHWTFQPVRIFTFAINPA